MTRHPSPYQSSRSPSSPCGLAILVLLLASVACTRREQPEIDKAAPVPIVAPPPGESLVPPGDAPPVATPEAPSPDTDPPAPVPTPAETDPGLPMPTLTEPNGEPTDEPSAEQALEDLGYIPPSKRVADALAPPPGGVQLSRKSLLWIDPKSKRVIVDGYVAQQQAYLEMFACPAETKEHEAVVAVVAESSELHAALLAIGAEPGKTVQFDPEYVPASGQKIRIWVMWRDAAGEVQVTDARNWVRRYDTDESLDRDWVFAGSSWWTDPVDGREYYQADSGEMICVSNFSTALLDLPIESSQATGALQFEAFTERVPPRGTPIRLVLAPLTDADDTPDPPGPEWMPPSPATNAAPTSTLPPTSTPTPESSLPDEPTSQVPPQAGAGTQGLVAHWPLHGDAIEAIHGTATEARGDGVRLIPGRNSVTFGGSGSWLEVAASDAPSLGSGDFTLAMWVRCDGADDLATGDLISRYDPATRRGFHLTLKQATGVTTSAPNHRHLQFGIDADDAGSWRDVGRPGKAILAFALAVHEGELYAGTCEPGADESGRVYRFAGSDGWVDCGAPDGSNSVTSLAVYRGELYAGTGKYRLAGSSLPESPNETLGGRVFRYAGDQQWIDCGPLPNTEAVGGLVVFRDRLHASSLYRPAGFFRYEPAADGTTGTWISLPLPQGIDPETGEPRDLRVEALCVHEGYLYGSSYDGGRVHRLDGETWVDCGLLGDNTQTYSFAQYDGELHVGTWPSGRVYRFAGIDDWFDVGRLGEELEVMGMMVHNGRLFAGTLPLAEVHAFDGQGAWTRLTQLDETPDVRYRRAWTMAEHAGELFCTTLPSGHVHAFSQGRQVAWGHPLPKGWHHVAAARAAGRLSLHVDGQLVASHDVPADYDLDAPAPLRIGAGYNGTLNGQLSDLRIFDRALSTSEIEALVAANPPAVR